MDDLVSIFGGMSASGAAGGGIGGVDGAFGGLGSMSPHSGNHIASPLDSLPSPTTSQKPQEDLLGLF